MPYQCSKCEKKFPIPATKAIQKRSQIFDIESERLAYHCCPFCESKEIKEIKEHE